MDPLGNFYGITGGGGLYGNGTIFKFSYKGGKLQGQYLFNFPNCMQGCYPQGTLARDSVGNPYDMAQGGTLIAAAVFPAESYTASRRNRTARGSTACW